MTRDLPGGARGDQAGLAGEDDELRPVAGTEFDHRAADVGLSGGGLQRLKQFVKPEVGERQLATMHHFTGNDRFRLPNADAWFSLL